MLSPGDLVAGKYRIERPLGEGGMGAVFVAVNEKLKKRVALKLLRREVANVKGAAERFTREAIAASSAKHPGIIEIYDADTHEGLPWIAMELLEGESLAARMERGRVPLDEVLDLACQALAALAHVHRAGIIHRDLKPDNLFLEELPEGGRRVKILDFGIAASSGPELARVTQTGMAIGTPAYLAPEQAAGQSDLDGRVDVYAMGVILFELITGRLPYPAHSVGEMVMLMYTKGPPSLAREAPYVPPALAALVDMCLAIDRAHRVQSTESLRRELESLRPLVRALGVPSTNELPVGGGAPATPVGNPEFASPVPRTQTPQEMAYAATAYAPATPPGSVPGASPHALASAAPHPSYAPSPFAPTGHAAASHPPPSHSTPIGHGAPSPVASASPAPYAAHPSSPPPIAYGAPPAHPSPYARPSGRSGLVVVLAAGAVLGAIAIGVTVAAAIVLVSREEPEVVTVSASRGLPPAPPAEPAMEPIVPAPVPTPAPPPELAEAEGEAPSEAEDEPERERANAREGEERPRARTRRTLRPAPAPTPAPSPSPAPATSEPARPLDNATIVRVLENNEARLDRCYFDAYPDRPRPRLRTEVDLSIGRDGRVTDASVTSGRPVLDACVRRVLHGTRFPAHPWPTRARFPMTFVDEP